MSKVLKWLGGKGRVSGDIIVRLGDITRYFEPFLGSGAVFFDLKSKGFGGVSVLGDDNARLIEVYKAIQQDPVAVIDSHEDLPREGWEDAYDLVRHQFNKESQTGALHAARFLWLNKTCWNGLYRVNSKGGFNVPVGRYVRPSWVRADTIRMASASLQDALLGAAPFGRIMGLATQEGDAVYCDPPYMPTDQENPSFTQYTKGGFNRLDHIELARQAVLAADRGARVVISNHDTEWVREELYPESQGFRVCWTASMTRTVGAKGSKVASELMVKVGG